MSWGAARSGLVACGIAVLLCHSAAAQQSLADFYRGKTVDFIVGYPPGAGYDLYGRALAQFMGKFIPGNPSVVVKNMPGASSLKALQYIAEQAPRDGATIGMFNPNLINLSMLEPNTVNVDFSKLTLLGNMSSDTKVCFAWKGSGIQTADDLRHRPFVIGGTAQGAGFVYGAIMRAVFGDNIKIVLGYPSNSDVWVALECGEADGNCTGWGVIPAMRPEWVKDDKINVLVQFAEKPSPHVPPAPPIYDQNISDELKAAIRFLTITDAIPRPVVAPPGIAPDRAAALQQAFFATLDDPDFLAFAKKATLEIDPMRPDVLEQLIEEIRTTPGAAVELAKKLSQQQ